MNKRVASRLILIRPIGFRFDPGTAGSNAFQREIRDVEIEIKARTEFDDLLYVLDRCGIHTDVFDPVNTHAPNAVFPNNWFSTHADGTLVLYPMFTESRRVEVDRNWAQRLAAEGYSVIRTVDLTELVKADRYLEGTGSMVLDRADRTAYAALSPRTTDHALVRWCAAMEHDPITFTATMNGTLTGAQVYHTNVVMAIGEGFALICMDAIPYPADREDLLLAFERAGLEFIPISLEQMHAFAGNMLHVRSEKQGSSSILLSSTAFASLGNGARTALEKHGQLVPVDVPTIETVGGGSVRCMLAENFLPLLPLAFST